MRSEKGIVFFPTRELEGSPEDFQLPYENVFFPAADGTRLHGWFVPATRPEVRATLLWFHGNAGNISHRLDNLARLHRHLDLSIFIFDYREFGLSAGAISKAGTYDDARGAWRYLVEERRINPRDILPFGRSLGTALAVFVASAEPCLGVILEAAFTSSHDMLRRYFPSGVPAHLLQSSYDNLSNIARIQAPILFIHAEHDEAIPMEMAERLYQRAQTAKRFYVVPGASHNDTYVVGGDAYVQQWHIFLDECLKRQGRAVGE
ncbi:MAG TPA: alpha/beta hydrolase [Syntrophobacteria bacterium]|nr:alpha/beta hydrolase [Syntrophobacteria bacterium]